MTCEFCGGFIGHHGPYCRCFKEYHKDIEEDHLPPGISRKAFTYAVWRTVRSIELHGTLCGDTTEKIRESVLKYVQMEEDAYQRRKEQEEAMRNVKKTGNGLRSRYTY